jgi:hypothetical protein
MSPLLGPISPSPPAPAQSETWETPQHHRTREILGSGKEPRLGAVSCSGSPSVRLVGAGARVLLHAPSPKPGSLESVSV